MSPLLRGASYPLRGLRLLAAHTSLWPWAVAPALLVLVLVLAAAWAAWTLTPALVLALFPVAPTPLLASFRHAVTVTLGLFLFLGAALVLYGSAGVLATPFTDRLSQKVEDLARGGAEEAFSWAIFARDVARSAWHSVLALGLWLLVLAVLSLANLLPVVGSLVELAGSALFTSLFVARELMDGAMSRRRMSFPAKLRFVRAHWRESAGLGGVAAILLAVPLVNLLALPAAIAGGTLLYLDLQDPARRA